MASGSGNNNNLTMGEHMFDKVLTSSDVGKLNRLVIPKHYAENYFPIEDNQNSKLFDFQDRNGKTWTFRYLYWSSSQSYVMTKGWIGFVKEKNLDKGDTVSFLRGYAPDDNEPDKRRKIYFVDWRHKPDINHYHHYPIFMSPPPFYHNQLQERDFLGYGYGGRHYAGPPLDHHHHYQYGRSEPLVYNSYPVYPTTRVPSSEAMLPSSPPSQPQPLEGTAKKVRLFGVDVEEEEECKRKGKSLDF